MFASFGIVEADERTARFDCGCTAHNDGTLGFLLVMCPRDHFGMHAEIRSFREHRATHKRARRACKFCHGAEAPGLAA